MSTEIAEELPIARNHAVGGNPRGHHRHREPITGLWGVSPIAPIHLGFDRTLRLLKKLSERGWKLSIVIADYHSVLSHSLQWPDVSNRSHYYHAYLRHCCGLSGDIYFGSQFQTNPEYFEMLLRASNQTSLASVRAALPSRPAGRDLAPWPDLGAAIYQVMQCVDAAYFGANAIVADAGQRKTYQLMKSFGTVSGISHHAWRRGPRGSVQPRTPRLLSVPTGIDIRGCALRDSSTATRISIHETRESLGGKVQRMYAPPAHQPEVPGVPNALLWHFQNSVFPWRIEPVVIESGRRQFRYSSFEAFKAEYDSGFLHPTDCKDALAEALWHRISLAQRALAKVLVDWIKQ